MKIIKICIFTLTILLSSCVTGNSILNQIAGGMVKENNIYFYTSDQQDILDDIYIFIHITNENKINFKIENIMG